MIATLSRWLANQRVAYERRRAGEDLSRLTDAQLDDVGLDRGSIAAYVENGLPFVETVGGRGRSFAPSLQGCG